MPIKWDELDEALGDAIKNAAAKTDSTLSGEITKLTRMTDADVKALFPTPADVQKLADLLKIVKGAQTRNDKVQHLTDSIESLGGTVITLLEKFV